MAGSLRDQLEASYDKIVTVPDAPVVDEPVETPAPVETPTAPPSSRIAEAPKAAPKAAPTGEERARGPDGKFIEKEAAPAVQTAAKVHPAKVVAPEIPVAPAVPAKPRPPRPSSWKKEYWDQWEKLDPSLAEYLHTRESQYASGVSTYKAEAEAAKPLMEAVSQFLPELQQHGIEPTKWISSLGQAHRILSLGSPQQKLQMFAKLSQDYGVPVQALLDPQAQQQYLAQGQNQQPYQPPQQRPLTRDEAQKLFQEQFLRVNSEQELQQFSANVEQHPHYDEVRATMAALLQSNLADDLESAYQTALRHPRHQALWDSIQEQERVSQEEVRRQAEAQRVLKAKAKAVSSPSATPSGPGSEEKATGLRSTIESAWEKHAGGGRV